MWAELFLADFLPKLRLNLSAELDLLRLIGVMVAIWETGSTSSASFLGVSGLVSLTSDFTGGKYSLTGVETGFLEEVGSSETVPRL